MTDIPIPARPSTQARPLVVQKLLYDGSKSYRWVGREIHRDADHLFFTAIFERDGRDLGYVRFEKVDVFYEWYYFDRWYNVFQVYSAGGELKGWYCNVTQPALVADDEAGGLAVRAVDLALDYFLQPSGKEFVLDEDEFAALPLTPETAAAAWAALAELRRLAAERAGPFAAGA